MKLHITKTDLELFAEFDAAMLHLLPMTISNPILEKLYFWDIYLFALNLTSKKINTKASAHAELNALYEGLDVLL